MPSTSQGVSERVWGYCGANDPAFEPLALRNNSGARCGDRGMPQKAFCWGVVGVLGRGHERLRPKAWPAPWTGNLLELQSKKLRRLYHRDLKKVRGELEKAREAPLYGLQDGDFG